MFARSLLEARIRALPLEIQQIIFTKVWQNITIVNFVGTTKYFSSFLGKIYILSQYLEHTLLAPQGEQLIQDANNVLRRIDGVVMGLVPHELNTPNNWLYQGRTTFVCLFIQFLWSILLGKLESLLDQIMQFIQRES